MWKTKLCLGTGNYFGADEKTQMKLFRETGFEAFFTGWDGKKDLCDLRKYADELGLIFQSVHAPYSRSADLWKTGPKAEAAVAELLRCVEDTAKAGVDLMICHCWIGFNGCTPTAEGIENYRIIVRRAAELGVRVAFENTEGEEALHTLLEAFRDEPNVGFCWDPGHEQCYNRGQDLLAKYGDRLLGTHINDNLGIRDYGGTITCIDDLHLLPFDGIVDWPDVARRLSRWNADNILTFELTPNSMAGRHENDVYRLLGLEGYVAECYKRACRVAVLVQHARNTRN